MNATVIEVKMGNEFSIDIEENASTGYTSKLKLDSSKINLHSKTFPNKKPMNMVNPMNMPIGGSHKVKYTFSTKEVGEFEIQIIFLRPWIGETEDDTKLLYKIISK